MHVEEEEEDDSPPASPPVFEHASLPLDPFVSEETKIKEDTEVALPAKHKVINFGVDFLLGKQDSDVKVNQEKLEEHFTHQDSF